jgi:hypothetical protein
VLIDLDKVIVVLICSLHVYHHAVFLVFTTLGLGMGRSMFRYRGSVARKFAILYRHFD